MSVDFPEPDGPMMPTISPLVDVEGDSAQGVDEVVLAHDVALVEVEASYDDGHRILLFVP